MRRLAPVRLRVDGRPDHQARYAEPVGIDQNLSLGLIVWASLFGLAIISSFL